MSKEYTSLGLMSGTSMDGVDASIIKSDGETKNKVIKDEYFEYPQGIYLRLIKLRDNINNPNDLNTYFTELKDLEKDITIFHAKAIKEILNKVDTEIDLIGFHGQTIFHSAKKKISKQLGDGKLLSQLVGKNVIYNFRKNDLDNEGEGAPLTPVYHQLLEKNLNLKPVSFVNLGGILNVTTINKSGELSAKDEWAGMCMIDKWVRKNSKKKFDLDGKLGNIGKIDQLILNQYMDNFHYLKPKKRSYDTNDFDISFARGLSLEDGAATITSITVNIIYLLFLENSKLNMNEKMVLCGGGRKNKFLFNKIKEFQKDLKTIDDFGVNGDFVESQAFAYLAIRSFLGLPISFPKTTGCKKPCTGGEIIKIK